MENDKAYVAQLYEHELSSIWKTRRLMANAYRVQSGVAASRHYNGGPLPHQGGTCPQCQKQLTLLWDLDLSDPLVPKDVRKGFAPATRFPLLICWQCLAVSYQVESDQRLKCFPFDWQTEFCNADESPFVDSPAILPRKPISLTRVPSQIDGLLSLYDVVGVDELDEEAKQILRAYHGRPMKWGWDVMQSQVGGQPLYYQGRSDLICPNPDCLGNRMTYPYVDGEKGFLMKELAVIHHDDPETLPMLDEEFFQLLYSVCVLCFSVRVEYRCT